MIFTETQLVGVYAISLKKREDERGFFARSWCQNEFEKMGLPSRIAQANISCNRKKHTLRGFHYQVPPYEEDKLLRCTRGAVYDVVIDLRPDSPSYKKSTSIVLSQSNHLM